MSLSGFIDLVGNPNRCSGHDMLPGVPGTHNVLIFATLPEIRDPTFLRPRRRTVFCTVHSGTADLIEICVAEEPRAASSLPIARVVRSYFDPRSQSAEKEMLVNVSDDADVSPPDNQVAWLGIEYSAEFRDAVIEVARRSVGVRQAGAFIKFMHEVRAVEVGLVHCASQFQQKEVGRQQG